ncbi:hypothetical protein [Roseicella aerolata]|uniref:Uncharacterized protein n=1 Tax=Roseicella aerolata TaxID=2883479 RepID=A0A9X1L8T1_9PROT|nr:hypothetical protein [Roseicella aerolata]MCB4823421.1 hypothetical protein [Roseicella aerolata]
MSGALREIRQLGQAAAAADDAALARLVALLDRVPRRGEADRVLDPVRPRLRALGLLRPLGLPRLLFLPLDGAIQPAARWTRGAAAVPRSALVVLAEMVGAALGEEAAAIATACAALSTADAGQVAVLGGRLWTRAADALPEAPPPGWERTGLAPADYPAIAALCRPVWRAGPAIWAALAAAEIGPPEELAEAALRAVAPAGLAPLSAVLATLLKRAAAPGAVARIAAGLDPTARPVAVQALEAMLAQPPPDFAALDPHAAAEQAAATARRLADLESSALLAGERQGQVQAWRRAADEACRAGFLAAAERQLVAPALRLATAPVVTDADVMAIEAGARGLRALQTAGRRLGGAAAYDRALRDLTGSLLTLAAEARNPAGLRPVDLARSIEILVGPDAAAALLGPQPSAGTP